MINLSHQFPRERFSASELARIQFCHCERSEAISFCQAEIASAFGLAMTEYLLIPNGNGKSVYHVEEGDEDEDGCCGRIG